MTVRYTANATCDLCGIKFQLEDLYGPYADHMLRKEGWQIGKWAICPGCAKKNCNGMAQRRAKNFAEARIIKDRPDRIPEHTGGDQ